MEIRIPEKSAEKITVAIGAEKFDLRKPTIGMMRRFQKELKSGGSEFELMADFCIKCGVPESIVDDMELDQMQSFFSQLNKAFEKKS